MKQAFIAYAPPDQRIAVKLWAELKWRGLDVGIDLEDVLPHLERSALLEDIVFNCEIVILIVSQHTSTDDELRRLHLLAIEQEANIIVLLHEEAHLPDVLQSAQTVTYSRFSNEVEQIVAMIPDSYFTSHPNIDRVMENLRHDDPDVRRPALFLVGKMKLTVAMHMAMALLLTDKSPEVRAAAAWALDQIGNVEAVNALLAALEDSAYDVRSNAGWGLVNIGRRRDSAASRAITPAVIAILRDGERFGTREMAYQVLLRLGGREAYDAIDRYWKNR